MTYEWTGLYYRKYIEGNKKRILKNEHFFIEKRRFSSPSCRRFNVRPQNKYHVVNNTISPPPRGEWNSPFVNTLIIHSYRCLCGRGSIWVHYKCTFPLLTKAGTLQHIICQHPSSTTWTFWFFYNNHPFFFVERFIITKTSTINKLEATAWTIVTPDNVNNNGDVHGTQSDESVTKADEFPQHTSDNDYMHQPVIWKQQQKH